MDMTRYRQIRGKVELGQFDQGKEMMLRWFWNVLKSDTGCKMRWRLEEE